MNIKKRIDEFGTEMRKFMRIVDLYIKTDYEKENNAFYNRYKPDDYDHSGRVEFTKPMAGRVLVTYDAGSNSYKFHQGGYVNKQKVLNLFKAIDKARIDMGWDSNDT